MKDRGGFSIVELMIVALLGALMVMTAYQVLITNQQTYRVQNTRTQVQRSTRAAMDMLISELREISARDGDILSFSSDEIEFRAMTTLGGVCTVDMVLLNTIPKMTVRKIHADFQAGDSVVVFADNDPNSSTDDAWIKARITSVDTTSVCTDVNGVTYEATRMAFAGQAGTFLADTVRQGAPMRAYTNYTYGLTPYGGEDYLGRSESGDNWVPLVGPLAGATGRPALEFAYFEADGSTATTADEIARVDVLLRSYSKVLDQNGDPVVDTLSTSVYVRN